MTQKHKRQLIIILVIIGILVLLRYVGIGKYFSLAYLKEYSEHFKNFIDKYYWSSTLVFLSGYALLIALGFPSVGPLTLLGGFLFGFLPGALYSVIAGTLGSIVTFLVIRYIFGTGLQKKYQDKLEKFNTQIHEHGISYLLMLHFLTVIPYFVINSLAALTNVPFWTFLWTTIVGSIPMALIYSFAGLKLSEVERMKDIFSPGLIAVMIVLILLALMPILIKRYKKLLNL